MDRWSHHRTSRAAQRSSTSKLVALCALVVVAVGVVWYANANSASADAGTSNRYEDLASQWKARGDAYQAAREQDHWAARDDHAHRILHDVNWHLERLRKAEARHEEPEIRGAVADLGSDLREWNSMVAQDRAPPAGAR
jgi:hypothetical protein